MILKSNLKFIYLLPGPSNWLGPICAEPSPFLTQFFSKLLSFQSKNKKYTYISGLLKNTLHWTWKKLSLHLFGEFFIRSPIVFLWSDRIQMFVCLFLSYRLLTLKITSKSTFFKLIRTLFEKSRLKEHLGYKLNIISFFVGRPISEYTQNNP